MAVVMFRVDNSVSIDRVADTAPPLEVLSAAGTEMSVTTGDADPLTVANVIALVLSAKNALFDAALCANAPDALLSNTLIRIAYLDRSRNSLNLLEPARGLEPRTC